MSVLGTGLKVLIGVSLVGGLAFGVWTGSQIALRKSSERELAQAWGAFSKCTLGDAPLGADLPSVRYRAVQLGPGATDWPTRCGVYQGMLYNASHRAARFGVRAFEEDLPRADVGYDSSTFSATPEQIDKFYLDAAQLPPGPVNLRGVPAAPPPADLVRLSKQKPLSSKPVMASDLVARGDLRLLFPDKVCWLRASDQLGTAMCSPIAGDAADRVLAGSEDGFAPVVLPRGDSGFVKADGTTLLLGQGDPYAIVKKTPDGKSTRLAFGRPYGQNIASMQLVDDALLWVVGTTTDPWGEDSYGGSFGYGAGYYSLEMYARTLSESGQLGGSSDLGSPWGNQGTIDTVLGGCRTGEALFMRTKASLYTRTKKEWLPVTAAPLGMQNLSESMSCNGAEAVIVGLSDPAFSGTPTVQQTRCTAASCSTSAVALEPASGSVTRNLAAVTTMGDPVVLAREMGGLRVRVGRLTDLPTVPDRVLLDGETGQPGSEGVTQLRLYARGAVAVLIVEAEKGTFAFRIEGSGKITPVDVK